MDVELAYGPVPSRRLGRSLGINNVPPKTCSYGCVYCQLGPTTMPSDERQSFYAPSDIESAVEERLAELDANGASVDTLTIVPDGEPTLDAQLGETIDLLDAFDADVAVITNGSLLHRESVREALSGADWISVTVDGGSAPIWRSVDRPHGSLSFETFTRGLRAFAREFDGTLTTETMLVAGTNDDRAAVESTADLVAEIDPETAYVAVPTRPPAEEWVEPPDEVTVVRAYERFDEQIDSVEYLIGAEGEAFGSTGELATDVLGITAVHPMRRSQVKTLVAEADADWSVIESLLETGDLLELEYGDETFYARPIDRERE
ncbi:radical SAM protein [Halanaeroarchaeum sulfurireducens]|uniref:Radical SAM domain-containing protein n=1 Tax=Halanaeroarchaeum sulfurireducens TaxID=1604004 RepID=A0A0F7P8P8_9EURY|nr:radical SAM protein [Halanaeroarchaeum sulfurireducens]AKH97541.1 radical SAM domain-containing protein [Halanaeroarchaeum sulfurireducens]ALG81937.1 radical SAM domain-containing protein [Halanaeroarchaeum sulfurireducens]